MLGVACPARRAAACSALARNSVIAAQQALDVLVCSEWTVSDGVVCSLKGVDSCRGSLLVVQQLVRCRGGGAFHDRLYRQTTNQDSRIFPGSMNVNLNPEIYRV